MYLYLDRQYGVIHLVEIVYTTREKIILVSTLPVIDDYMSGVYTKDEAVNHLLPQNLTDQYAFLTKRALVVLEFIASEQV